MKLSTTVLRSAPTVLLLLAVPPALAQTVRYVDADATGPVHDGSTWCNAYTTLGEALDVAGGGDAILVADGIYTPDSTGLDDPREATFQLINGVTVRGGYAGQLDGGNRCRPQHPDRNRRDTVGHDKCDSGNGAGLNNSVTRERLPRLGIGGRHVHAHARGQGRLW